MCDDVTAMDRISPAVDQKIRIPENAWIPCFRMKTPGMCYFDTITAGRMRQKVQFVRVKFQDKMSDRQVLCEGSRRSAVSGQQSVADNSITVNKQLIFQINNLTLQ